MNMIMNKSKKRKKVRIYQSFNLPKKRYIVPNKFKQMKISKKRNKPNRSKTAKQDQAQKKNL